MQGRSKGRGVISVFSAGAEFCLSWSRRGGECRENLSICESGQSIAESSNPDLLHGFLFGRLRASLRVVPGGHLAHAGAPCAQRVYLPHTAANGRCTAG